MKKQDANEESELVELALDMIQKTDNLGFFWHVIQVLIDSNMLFEDGDFKVIFKSNLTRRFYENGEWKSEELEFDQPRELIYFNTNRLFSMYKTQCLEEGEKPMPISTLEYYLRNSPAFVCETQKESFKKIDPRTGKQECDELGVKKRTSTTAIILEIQKTGLQMSSSDDL